MQKQKYTKQQFILRLVLSLATLLVGIAAYIAFGFFFDVFIEIIPILLFPIIMIPFIWLNKRELDKLGSVIGTVILLVLTAAASAGVGVVATSKPAYGQKPCCGSVRTQTYSRNYMLENYDINQKTVVNVWLPENYTADKKYPVMYVLDGDMLFGYASVKAAELCKNGDGDVIIVGIGYGYWNSSFARGGIVWQDEEHVRGRWRDFCFADDTQEGYIKGTDFGGDMKRGKEFVKFLTDTVVKDIRSKYSTDTSNSTVFGHSLGGGMAAYLLTQYDPSLKEDIPFTNFVIVDNGYLDYYNRHYFDLQNAMSRSGNRAFGALKVYRIWGGAVNPQGDAEQYELYARINAENWTDCQNYFYLPENANHSDTETIGLDNALLLTLNIPFQHS